METLERTNEEQAEYVKYLIKRYWLLAVIIIVALVGAIYGGHAYKKNQKNKLDQAAIVLDDFNKDIQNKKLDAALVKASDLQKESVDTSLSMIATLKLAKAYFDTKDYDQAIKQYDWVINQSIEPSIVDIAKIRKAKVLTEIKKIDEAIQLLDSITSDKSEREVALLKGDIYYSVNQYDNAIKAYQSIAEEPVVTQRIQLAKLKQEATLKND